MVEYKHNQVYYKLQFSELDAAAVQVLSFDGSEGISQLFEYRFHLLSADPELDAANILNKKATFLIARGEEELIPVHGIISQFEQRGRSPDYVEYFAVLVPKMWRLNLTYQSQIYQNMDIEKIVTQVLKDAGFSGEDYEFNLNESYPQHEYVVQYRETDLNFINRRLEHFGIFYYFEQRDDNDVIIFTDSNDGIYGIEQEEDIFYNPNQDILHDKETITEITCQERVVTGLVQLKDYNYRFPGKQLQAESQIDSEAPGKYYEYGDHFKDEKEGDFLARIRNEEILSTRKIYSGRSDCRLFRAGFRFKMGKHYREEWNEQEYILTRLYLRGDQSGLFPYLMQGNQIVPTYENSLVAIPADVAFRPPRVTPVPKLYGILTAKLESGAGDEYAFMDDQGRYKIKVPFDLSDKTDGNASRVIRMSQPYSGPGYGIHFPNHADSEIIWTCIDGDLDRPLGLGTIPNPSNSSPSTSANKSQSVIRTAGQNELTFDDKTGSENILLHGTKDWTIDIVNDKNQTIGNNETASVGNDRTRDVGNNETISIGSNRDKTVGANQSETIGANKTISVTGNHTETIAGNMSQTVSGNKTETVAIAKTTSIGAVFQISVGAAMNETVGAVKAEEIGATKSVNVGVNSSEDVGSNKSVNAGGNISESAGKDVAIQAGKKMVLASGDDFAISGGKKGVIDIKDQLTLKCGKAEITLKKNGDILINGKKINIKGSGDIVMKGKKVLQN